MDNEIRQFSFTGPEAEAAARAELGTGDLPGRMTTGMMIILVILMIVRIALNLPLPSFRVLGSYMVAVAAWAALILFVSFRLRKMREEMTESRFYLQCTQEGIAAGRFPDEMLYRTAWEEIRMVEQGTHIYRITSPAGRLSIPKTALTAEERQRLDALDAEQKLVNWM